MTATQTLGTVFTGQVENFLAGIQRVHAELKNLEGMVGKISQNFASINKGFDNVALGAKKAISEYKGAVAETIKIHARYDQALASMKNKGNEYAAAFQNLTKSLQQHESVVKKIFDSDSFQKNTQKLSDSLKNGIISNSEYEKSLRKLEEQAKKSLTDPAYGKFAETLNTVGNALGGTRAAYASFLDSTVKLRAGSKELANELNNIAFNAQNLTKLSKEQLAGVLTGTSQSVTQYLAGLKEATPLFKAFATGSQTLRDQVGLLSEAFQQGRINLDGFNKTLTTLTQYSGSKDTAFAKQLTRLTQDLKDGKVTLSEFEGVLRRLDKAYGATADAQQKSTAQMDDANKKIKDQINLWEELINRAKTYGKFVASSAIVYGVVNSLRDAFSEIVNFDQALQNLSAVTLTDNFAEIIASMKEMVTIAKNSKFSLVELSEGMVLTAQTGYNVTESLELINAESVLASATLTDLATAADLITSSLVSFGKEATDAMRVTDIMANAINLSKLTIEKLRIAFNYIGVSASQAGVQLKEAATSFALFASSGLRASTIGTSFRQIMSKLLDPTEKVRAEFELMGVPLDKLDPKVATFRETLRTLASVLKDGAESIKSQKGYIVDMAKAYELFQLRGAQGAAILAEAFATGKWDEMLKKIADVGTAMEMQQRQMEGLAFKLKNLGDIFKVVAVHIGEAGLTGAIHIMVDSLKLLLNLIDTFVSSTSGQFIIKTGLIAAALKTMSVAMTGFVIPAMTALGTNIGLVLLNISNLAVKIPIVSEAIFAFALGFRGLAEGMSGFASVLKNMPVLLQAVIAALTLAVAGYIQFKDRLKESAEALSVMALEYERNINALRNIAKGSEEMFKTGDVEQYQQTLKAFTKQYPELIAQIKESAGVADLASISFDKLQLAIQGVIKSEFEKQITANIEAMEKFAIVAERAVKKINDDSDFNLSFDFGKIFGNESTATKELREVQRAYKSSVDETISSLIEYKDRMKMSEGELRKYISTLKITPFVAAKVSAAVSAELRRIEEASRIDVSLRSYQSYFQELPIEFKSLYDKLDAVQKAEFLAFQKTLAQKVAAYKESAEKNYIAEEEVQKSVAALKAKEYAEWMLKNNERLKATEKTEQATIDILRSFIDKSLSEFRRGNISRIQAEGEVAGYTREINEQYVEGLKKAYQSAKSLTEGYVNTLNTRMNDIRSKIASLTQEITASDKSYHDDMRDLRQKTMSDEQKWLDDREEANRLLQEGMASQNVEMLKQAQGMFKSLARTVTDENGKAIAGVDDTVKVAQQGVEASHKAAADAMKRQRDEFAQNMNDIRTQIVNVEARLETYRQKIEEVAATPFQLNTTRLEETFTELTGFVSRFKDALKKEEMEFNIRFTGEGSDKKLITEKTAEVEKEVSDVVEKLDGKEATVRVAVETDKAAELPTSSESTISVKAAVDDSELNKFPDTVRAIEEEIAKTPIVVSTKFEALEVGTPPTSFKEKLANIKEELLGIPGKIRGMANIFKVLFVGDDKYHIAPLTDKISSIKNAINTTHIYINKLVPQFRVLMSDQNDQPLEPRVQAIVDKFRGASANINNLATAFKAAINTNDDIPLNEAFSIAFENAKALAKNISNLDAHFLLLFEDENGIPATDRFYSVLTQSKNLSGFINNLYTTFTTDFLSNEGLTTTEQLDKTVTGIKNLSENIEGFTSALTVNITGSADASEKKPIKKIFSEVEEDVNNFSSLIKKSGDFSATVTGFEKISGVLDNFNSALNIDFTGSVSVSDKKSLNDTFSEVEDDINNFSSLVKDQDFKFVTQFTDSEGNPLSSAVNWVKMQTGWLRQIISDKFATFTTKFQDDTGASLWDSITGLFNKFLDFSGYIEDIKAVFSVSFLTDGGLTFEQKMDFLKQKVRIMGDYINSVVADLKVRFGDEDGNISAEKMGKAFQAKMKKIWEIIKKTTLNLYYSVVGEDGIDFKNLPKTINEKLKKLQSFIKEFSGKISFDFITDDGTPLSKFLVWLKDSFTTLIKFISGNTAELVTKIVSGEGTPIKDALNAAKEGVKNTASTIRGSSALFKVFVGDPDMPLTEKLKLTVGSFQRAKDTINALKAAFKLAVVADETGVPVPEHLQGIVKACRTVSDTVGKIKSKFKIAFWGEGSTQKLLSEKIEEIKGEFGEFSETVKNSSKDVVTKFKGDNNSFILEIIERIISKLKLFSDIISGEYFLDLNVQDAGENVNKEIAKAVGKFAVWAIFVKKIINTILKYADMVFTSILNYFIKISTHLSAFTTKFAFLKPVLKYVEKIALFLSTKLLPIMGAFVPILNLISTIILGIQLISLLKEVVIYGKTIGEYFSIAYNTVKDFLSYITSSVAEKIKSIGGKIKDVFTFDSNLDKIREKLEQFSGFVTNIKAKFKIFFMGHGSSEQPLSNKIKEMKEGILDFSEIAKEKIEHITSFKSDDGNKLGNTLSLISKGVDTLRNKIISIAPDFIVRFLTDKKDTTFETRLTLAKLALKKASKEISNFNTVFGVYFASADDHTPLADKMKITLYQFRKMVSAIYSVPAKFIIAFVGDNGKDILVFLNEIIERFRIFTNFLIRTFGEVFKKIVSETIGRIDQPIAQAINAVIDTIQLFFDVLNNQFAQLLHTIFLGWDLTPTLRQKIVAPFESVIDKVVKTAQKKRGEIKESFLGLFTDAVNTSSMIYNKFMIFKELSPFIINYFVLPMKFFYGTLYDVIRTALHLFNVLSVSVEKTFKGLPFLIEGSFKGILSFGDKLKEVFFLIESWNNKLLSSKFWETIIRGFERLDSVIPASLKFMNSFFIEITKLTPIGIEVFNLFVRMFIRGINALQNKIKGIQFLFNSIKDTITRYSMLIRYVSSGLSNIFAPLVNSIKIVIEQIQIWLVRIRELGSLREVLTSLFKVVVRYVPWVTKLSGAFTLLARVGGFVLKALNPIGWFFTAWDIANVIADMNMFGMLSMRVGDYLHKFIRILQVLELHLLTKVSGGLKNIVEKMGFDGAAKYLDRINSYLAKKIKDTNKIIKDINPIKVKVDDSEVSNWLVKIKRFTETVYVQKIVPRIEEKGFNFIDYLEKIKMQTHNTTTIITVAFEKAAVVIAGIVTLVFSKNFLAKSFGYIKSFIDDIVVNVTMLYLRIKSILSGGNIITLLKNIFVFIEKSLGSLITRSTTLSNVLSKFSPILQLIIKGVDALLTGLSASTLKLIGLFAKIGNFVGIFLLFYDLGSALNNMDFFGLMPLKVKNAFEAAWGYIELFYVKLLRFGVEIVRIFADAFHFDPKPLEYAIMNLDKIFMAFIDGPLMWLAESFVFVMDIITNLNKLFTIVKNALSSLWQFIKENLAEITIIAGIMTIAILTLSAPLAGAAASIGILTAAIAALGIAITALTDPDFIINVVDAIIQEWERMKVDAVKVWAALVKEIKETWNLLIDALTFDFILDFFGGVEKEVKRMEDDIEKVSEHVAEEIEKTKNSLTDLFVFDFIVDGIEAVAKEWERMKIDAIKTWDAIIAGGTFDFIIDAISAITQEWERMKIDAVKSWNGLIGEMKETWDSLLDALTFDFIVDGISAISDEWERMKNDAIKSWDAIVKEVKENLDILMKIGGAFGKLLGMSEYEEATDSTMKNLEERMKNIRSLINEIYTEGSSSPSAVENIEKSLEKIIKDGEESKKVLSELFTVSEAQASELAGYKVSFIDNETGKPVEQKVDDITNSFETLQQYLAGKISEYKVSVIGKNGEPLKEYSEKELKKMLVSMAEKPEIKAELNVDVEKAKDIIKTSAVESNKALEEQIAKIRSVYRDLFKSEDTNNVTKLTGEIYHAYENFYNQLDARRKVSFEKFWADTENEVKTYEETAKKHGISEEQRMADIERIRREAFEKFKEIAKQEMNTTHAESLKKTVSDIAEYTTMMDEETQRRVEFMQAEIDAADRYQQQQEIWAAQENYIYEQELDRRKDYYDERDGLEQRYLGKNGTLIQAQADFMDSLRESAGNYGEVSQQEVDALTKANMEKAALLQSMTVIQESAAQKQRKLQTQMLDTEVENLQNKFDLSLSMLNAYEQREIAAITKTVADKKHLSDLEVQSAQTRLSGEEKANLELIVEKERFWKKNLSLQQENINEANKILADPKRSEAEKQLAEQTLKSIKERNEEGLRIEKDAAEARKRLGETTAASYKQSNDRQQQADSELLVEKEKFWKKNLEFQKANIEEANKILADPKRSEAEKQLAEQTLKSIKERNDAVLALEKGAADAKLRLQKEEVSAVKAVNQEKKRAEEAVSNEVRAINRQTIKERIRLYNDYITGMKAKLNEYRDKEKTVAGEILDIQNKINEGRKSAEQKIRDLKRKGMSEEAAYQDKWREYEELRAKAAIAMQTDRDKGNQLYEEAIDLANSLAGEVKNGEKVVVSEYQATQRAIEAIKKAEAEKEKALQSNKDSLQAEHAAITQSSEDVANGLQMAGEELQALKKQDKSLQIETNSPQVIAEIEQIQAALDNIKDKTVTVTVVRKDSSETAMNAGGEVQKYAGGGYVAFGQPGIDKVPAWLTLREFVQPVQSVTHYGLDLMRGLQKRLFPVENIRLILAAGTQKLRNLFAQKEKKYYNGGYVWKMPSVSTPSVSAIVNNIVTNRYSGGGLAQGMTMADLQNFGKFTLSDPATGAKMSAMAPAIDLEQFGKAVRRDQRLRYNPV